MLAEPYLTDFRTHTALFEGRIPWMYLDGPGNVTVGIGHLIDTAEAAARLPFTSTAARVRADWLTVKQCRADMIASQYSHFTISRLPADAIDTIFQSDCDSIVAQVQTFLPEYDGLPQPVQQAILDMAFNLGPAGLRHDYFCHGCRFGPAVLCGDWAAAALECVRSNIQLARNQYTAHLILSAAG